MKNLFKVRDDGVVEVRLQRGLVMLIDEADLARVSALPGTWGAVRQRGGQAYAAMRFLTNGRLMTVLAHRLIAATRGGLERGLEIDHVNGDGLDNRRANLREVTRAVNQHNRRAAAKRSKSGVLGAYSCLDRNKWRARVKVGGVTRNLGRFDTAEEAAAATGRFLAERRLNEK